MTKAQMRKYLFLDIDGVLNSARTFASSQGRLLGRYFLDREMIARLDQLLEATGAHVVISSCWRQGDGGEGVARILRACGMRHADRIVGETARLDGIRGTEIADWMRDRWDVQAFAIVDDDNDMGPLSPHLVQTSWQDGLQEEHVRRLIELLDLEVAAC